jgi:uncharacterized protein YndB with AHSA1/START domain
MPYTYTYTLTTTIPASAQEIYDAWLDSIGHSEMTGGAAEMSDEIGAEISAWDGYISGRNLELIPGERIVQSWRTTKFSDEHQDSIITVTLEELDDGTLLTLVHSNVPDDHRSYEEGGWHSRYFEPMQAYFAAGEPEPEEPEPEQAAPTPEPVRPSPKSRAPRTRRAAGRKTQTAAPPKASPAKKKPKRAAVAKTKRKTAKTTKRKPAKKSIKRPAAKRAATKRTTAKRTAAKGKAGPRKRR